MQTYVTKHSTILWAVAVSGTLVVLAGAVFGPRPAFALLCHQIPDRSFTVDGHLFAVCHRCTGIYIGLFLGLIGGAIPGARTLLRTWGLPLIASTAALVLADIGFDALHILDTTPGTRATTGLALGLSAGLFLVSIFQNTQPVDS